MSDNDFSFADEFKSFGDELNGVAYTGDYTMKVTKAKASKTAKGKQQFVVTLAFQGGPLGAKGKTVDNRLVWSPESEVAARIFAQSLRVLGAPQDWIMSAKPTPDQIAEQMVGAVVEVNLKAGEFNGQPQTNVNYRKSVSVNPLGGGQGGAVKTTSASAAAAVSLEDETADEQVDTTTGEVIQEPATAGAGAPGSAGNPWA
ncbi:hypothetical protein [Longimicrobium sp.]|jgi:hypothetical protein|uniref:hypothetical protein n=1 Tax=Longimicrobium sp. TaxID=2029185 RepID=UPI002EDA53A2